MLQTRPIRHSLTQAILTQLTLIRPTPIPRVPTNPANQPPTVSIVGDNPRVTAEALNYLTVEASDPDGGTLTYQWDITEGEAENVSFESPTSATTSVTFAEDGQYTLRVTVSDGDGGTASATVEFVVSLLPYSVTIDGTNPRSAVVGIPIELNAEESNPEDQPLTPEWTVPEGSPENISFSTPQSLTTTATFSQAGSYTVAVTLYFADAGDALTVSDSVVVNVSE